MYVGPVLSFRAKEADMLCMHEWQGPGRKFEQGSRANPVDFLAHIGHSPAPCRLTPPPMVEVLEPRALFTLTTFALDPSQSVLTVSGNVAQFQLVPTQP